MNEKRFLKVKDVQQILACGAKTAYEIVRQNDFPKITIGRSYYIPADEFEKWIKRYTGRVYKLNNATNKNIKNI